MFSRSARKPSTQDVASRQPSPQGAGSAPSAGAVLPWRCGSLPCGRRLCPAGLPATSPPQRIAADAQGHERVLGRGFPRKQPHPRSGCLLRELCFGSLELCRPTKRSPGLSLSRSVQLRSPTGSTFPLQTSMRVLP